MSFSFPTAEAAALSSLWLTDRRARLRGPDRRRARRSAADEATVGVLVPVPTERPGVWAVTFKRTLDAAGAAAGLVLLAPMLLFLAALVRATSRGPALFKQTRVGLGGRTFTMYKFRTMGLDAEARKAALASANEQAGPVFKMRRDPRITPVGRALRKYSLDELPQLWNVLRGDMSLVGPRPPVPQEVAQYRLWQLRRLAVQPGLTCLWQVSGRSHIAFDEWMRLDLRYIDAMSPLLDLHLLLRTVRVVVRGDGAY